MSNLNQPEKQTKGAALITHKTIAILASTIAIIGCTSTPVAISYYMLPTTVQENSVDTQHVPSLLIEHIELAEYLTQPGLVLQTSPHKIHISTSNLWAENLEKALPKALQNALQKQSAQFSYHLEHLVTLKPDLRLRLRIDALHPTTNGLVIASGRYQLTKASEQEIAAVKYFHIERTLHDDGYEAAVKEIDILISLIAVNILGTMNDI